MKFLGFNPMHSVITQKHEDEGIMRRVVFTYLASFIGCHGMRSTKFDRLKRYYVPKRFALWRGDVRFQKCDTLQSG